MERGEQLNSAELLEIAQEVKNGGEMPAGLTEEEKEGVREILDVLYASDKAVKVYWIRMAYLDKLKAAEAKKAEAQRYSAWALRSQMKVSEYYGKLRAIDSSYKKARASLDAEARKNINRINEQAEDMRKMLTRTLRSVSKRISERTKFTFGQIQHDVNVYVETLTLNQCLLEGNHKEAAASLGARLTELGDKINSVCGTDSYLGWAITDYKQKLSDMAVAIYKEYGVPLGRVYRNLAVRMNIAKKSSIRAERLYREKYGEYLQAAAEAKVEGKRTNLAGKWYIIAACGEMLAELGQSLMNS